jgi:gliding motility-associated-like protein
VLQPGGGPFTTSAPGLLEVLVQAGACSATDEAEVEVVAAFDAELPAEVAFCAGGGVQVVAQAGADSYAWSNGDIGLYGWADQAGLLTLETTVDGCVFVHQVAVDALPIPSPDLGPDGVFCAGTEVVLQSGYPNADWTNWNGEGGGSNFEVNAEGTFTVQVSVDGCIGEDEVEIDFIAVPEFDLGPDIERCPEDAVLLEAGPFMEPTSIVWNQGGNQPTHLASETGWYKATATSGDCTFSDSVYVAFDGHIEPMLSTEQHICMDAELTLDASEGIGNHLFPVSYLWETGDYHAEATIAHAGDFAVTLYNLCESVGLTISVDAIDCGCTVFVPSAFTPDNDGRNDRFIPIVGCEPSAYEFTVFNRWGEVVFRTEDVTEGWLGERQGGRNYYSAIDMYHWQLQLVWEQPGNRIPRHEYASGVVTMLR